MGNIITRGITNIGKLAIGTKATPGSVFATGLLEIGFLVAKASYDIYKGRELRNAKLEYESSVCRDPETKHLWKFDRPASSEEFRTIFTRVKNGESMGDVLYDMKLIGTVEE